MRIPAKEKIMTKRFHNAVVVLTVAALLGLAAGCRNEGDAGDPPLPRQRKASVSPDGDTITFAPNSPGLKLLGISTARHGTAMISMVAPARVVAAIASVGPPGESIVLFESPDVTSLYSQYRQARSNAALTEKNLARVKDMFENQAATAKDLNQAESDAANARASMAEFEAKMRAFGFNPAELLRVAPGTVWLISDVPESQLHEVEKGETVQITFSAFPGTTFHGRADAVGDIVDPATRTVKVRVSMPNPQRRFLPGMFARVDFGEPSRNAVLVPLETLVTVDAKDYVFVESSPATFVRRRVMLANPTPTEVAVLDGVQDGERVVTTGAMLLKGLSFGY